MGPFFSFDCRKPPADVPHPAGSAIRWRAALGRRPGTQRPQILDELHEVDGAAALGVAPETVEAACGGVAETSAVLLGVVHWAPAVEFLAVPAPVLVAHVKSGGGWETRASGSARIGLGLPCELTGRPAGTRKIIPKNLLIRPHPRAGF
jgi:hypothetical protein